MTSLDSKLCGCTGSRHELPCAKAGKRRDLRTKAGGKTRKAPRLQYDDVQVNIKCRDAAEAAYVRVVAVAARKAYRTRK